MTASSIRSWNGWTALRLGALVLAGTLLPGAAAAQGIATSLSASASGGPTGPQEAILKQVRLEQKMNAQIPLDTAWVDENGKQVRLHEYFGRKPVMLMLIQFRCTMLCTEQMNQLLESLQKLQFTPGKEFNLLILSIDSKEKPDLAAEMKQSFLKRYGRPAAPGLHFLTSDRPTIDRLSQTIGFHYVYDASTDQYAHPDGVMIATPEGRLARYYFKLEYPARDMRLGLVEAADGKIGTPLDAFALLCFHYNPVSGKYALAIMSLIRLGGIATTLGLLCGIAMMKQWERINRRRADRVA